MPDAQPLLCAALIFDMDGVIVDSNPVHVQTWAAYCNRFGIETGPELMERMYGRRNDEIVRDFFGEDLTVEESALHGAAKEQLYREVMKPLLEEALVPGIREFLANYAALPMALATNAEPENVSFVLDGSGLRRYFRYVVDGHQVHHAKPNPEIYLHTADLLGVSPECCVIFEDSYAGVAAARAAGARVVGLRTTHRDLPGVELAIDNFRSHRLESWLRAIISEQV